MSWGTNAMNYAEKASKWADTFASSSARTRTIYGAAAGGIIASMYGATIGREPGQSRLEGAIGGSRFTQLGIMGASALGARYGGFAFNAIGRTSGLRTALNGSRPGALSGVGRATFAEMQREAIQAKSYIGNGINKGFNTFRGLKH